MGLNKKVFKYQVPIEDLTSFEAPVGAELLHIAPGPNDWTLYAWALIDETKPAGRVSLCIVGTGNPVPHGLEQHNFFGTVVAPPFVWHVWRAGAW